MEIVQPRVILLVGFILLSISVLVARLRNNGSELLVYLRYVWALVLVVCISEWASFAIAVWVLAFFSFLALKEYFSLIDIRLQDRWGIVGAYLSIPFMTYLIQIHWYGMFIISIPVYTFLVIPLLIAVGGADSKGTVFSIGAIDFGLFLFVYCAGHVAYLLLFSTWMAVMLIVCVAICDMIGRVANLRSKKSHTGSAIRYLLAVPLTVIVAFGLSELMTLPTGYSLIIGVLIPALVVVGNLSVSAIESDLGIAQEELVPGTGQIIHGVKSYLFTAPVVFHYIRYFWEEPTFLQ